MGIDNIHRRLDVRFARLLEKICASYRNRYHLQYLQKKDNNWQKLFSKGEFFKHEIEDQLHINLYQDSILSRCIYDGFEENEITFIRRFLKSGDLFFDVGANIGLFSLVAAKAIGGEGKVYAFEPTPETYLRFCENIELNNELSNIFPFQLGLSHECGNLLFNVSSDGHDAWNSFVKLEQLENSQIITVDTVTLDFFVKNQGVNLSDIKLIKIDVEGWEMNVLKGAQGLLSDKNAPVLMVEFTEENAFSAGYYCGEIYDYVQQFGYKWYRYDSHKEALLPEKKQLHYPYDNLFAIKNIDYVMSRISNSSK